jgi:hypothetical protein
MGVGYQVSAVHRLMYLDMASVQTRAVVKDENPLLDVLGKTFAQIVVADGPLRTRSPAVESVLAWRQRLEAKYRDQLGEDLAWDEHGTFETSDDVATGADILFYYVAGVLDQRGQTGVRNLVHQSRPPEDEIDTVFTETDRRGFGGCFPQLLLGAKIWLPFERNLMIEEPNWDGKTDRYGSVSRLLGEVSTVRAGIADADSTVARFGEFDEPSQQILAAAWQASATILRLATLATARHLPLSKTG